METIFVQIVTRVCDILQVCNRPTGKADLQVMSLQKSHCKRLSYQAFAKLSFHSLLIQIQNNIKDDHMMLMYLSFPLSKTS